MKSSDLVSLATLSYVRGNQVWRPRQSSGGVDARKNLKGAESAVSFHAHLLERMSSATRPIRLPYFMASSLSAGGMSSQHALGESGLQ